MRLCRGFQVSGGAKCQSSTENPTGYCRRCRPKYEAIQINQMLYCVDCPLSERECPVRDRATTEHPKGPVCWYELYDEVPKFAKKEHVIEALKRIVGSNYRVALRLDRFVAAMGQYDTQLVNDYNRMAKSTFEQLKEYYKLRGWDEKEITKSSEMRIKTLDKIFANRDLMGESLPEPDGNETPIIHIETPDYDSEDAEELEDYVNDEDQETEEDDDDE